MKEILFRGKEIIGGKWREGDLVACKNNERTFITELIEVDEDSWLYWEVDPNTVGQYTGLTDKNDKKIFEGDIIRGYGSLGDAIIHTVNWNEKEAYFEIYNEYGSPCGRINQQWIEDFDKEIIGNIHDNPELSKI